MLEEKTRKIVFWVTVSIAGVVVIAGMASALRLLIRPAEATPALAITPADAMLCPGQQILFSVEPSVEDLEWAVTGGGEISAEGLYVAGDEPGSYEVQAAGPEGQRGRGVVYIVPCTPTPAPTPEPTSVPTPAPTPEPTPLPATDGEGDVNVYSSAAPVAQPPSGVDIRNASVGENGRVSLLTTEHPPALQGWAAEGEVVLWIDLYSPIPESMTVRTDWLFGLDLDSDTTTGRPAGAARINPDLGMEVAIGVYYDPLDGSYNPYLLVWDTAAVDWAEGPDVVRFMLSEDRTLVGLALPLETLREQVAQVTGVTIDPLAVRGRAAVVAYVTPEAVIDLYPDPVE